jgi:uncharacterized membrane protein
LGSRCARGGRGLSGGKDMKKVVIALLATALVGGVAGAMIKNLKTSKTTETVGESQLTVAEKKSEAISAPQSKTALLKVLNKKYSKKLPKKVSGKVRREMHKTMAQKSINPQVRSLAFIKARKGKGATVSGKVHKKKSGIKKPAKSA